MKPAPSANLSLLPQESLLAEQKEGHKKRYVVHIDFHQPKCQQNNRKALWLFVERKS
jgi:hypothetical protein